MTLSSIFKILRKVNKHQYIQVWGCITFANVLVSSFLAVLFSQFIQSTLPEGGDSRKQIYFIFAAAVIGCFIFVLYAAGLFIRHKSKEVGVFLALGTEKSRLSKALMKEIAYISFCAAVIGIGVGNILAFIIGKVFQSLSVDTENMVFSLSFLGVLYATIFAAVVFLFLIAMASTFMKKSNVIDIINEQRKSEPIKKEVTKKYIISGGAMFLLGLFLAAILPGLYFTFFKQYLSGLFNLFYLLCVFGLYRILVYSIVVHKRGKNPQKYYKNLISYGMLKFQGISMVRNMGLIMLLMIGALYAAFYLPNNIMAGNSLMTNNPVDVSYRFPESVEGIPQDKITRLADQYSLKIKNYRELRFIELLSSGVNRDDIDESNKLIEKYEKEAFYRQFTSDKNLNECMGTDISVKQGTYKMIRGEQMTESVLYSFRDLDYVKNEETGIGLELKYAGTEVFNELIIDNGWDTLSRIIISDEDYQVLEKGVTKEHIINQTLFNVDNLEASYMFSKELFKEYCTSVDERMKVLVFHDSYLEQKARENGEEYAEAQHIELQPENPEVELYWKYAPYFKILFQKNMLLQYGVLYLLFAYVAIVMLASVGIIAYTRSQSIGIRNRQIYEDVRKLGGNNDFILRCIKGQLKKVYLVPTAVGVTVIYLYQMMMLLQNDGRLTRTEGSIALIDFLLCLVVVAFQYVGYRLSLKEVKNIVLFQ